MARGFSFTPVGLSEFNQLTATRQAFERDRTQSIKNAFNDISLGLINRDIRKKYADPTSIEALTELSQRTAQIDPVASQRYGTLVDSALSSEQAKRDKELRDSLFGGGATGTSQTDTPQSMGVTVQTYGEDGQPTGQAATGVIKPRNLLEESKKEYFSGMKIGADGLDNEQRLAVQRMAALDTKEALKMSADYVSQNNRAFQENNKTYVKQAADWNKANPPEEVRKYNTTLNQLRQTQQALGNIIKEKKASGSGITRFLLSVGGTGARLRGALLTKDFEAKLIESSYQQNPELARQVVQIPDQAATVVQDSLRQILGAAYTQVEGENVLMRAFNPKDTDENNFVRLSRLLQRMQAYGEGRMELSAHLQKAGATIQNFRPSDSSLNIETLTSGVNSATGEQKLSVGQRAAFYNRVLGESGLINAETGEGGMSEAQLQDILEKEELRNSGIITRAVTAVTRGKL